MIAVFNVFGINIETKINFFFGLKKNSEYKYSKWKQNFQQNRQTNR